MGRRRSVSTRGGMGEKFWNLDAESGLVMSYAYASRQFSPGRKDRSPMVVGGLRVAGDFRRAGDGDDTRMEPSRTGGGESGDAGDRGGV
jgi:hypothetical protein